MAVQTNILGSREWPGLVCVLASVLKLPCAVTLSGVS